MVGKILMVCLFILIGIMLSLGKWSFLISGFNTMSKEEKEQYDVMSLCKFMGKIMFVVAFSIALFILSDILMIPILLNIGVVIIISSVIFAIIYANIGDRFEKKKEKLLKEYHHGFNDGEEFLQNHLKNFITK